MDGARRTPSPFVVEVCIIGGDRGDMNYYNNERT